MLPYIEIITELLLRTQSHHRKETKKVTFQKKQQTLHQLTKEIEQKKQTATLKYN